MTDSLSPFSAFNDAQRQLLQDDSSEDRRHRVFEAIFGLHNHCIRSLGGLVTDHQLLAFTWQVDYLPIPVSSQLLEEVKTAVQRAIEARMAPRRSKRPVLVGTL